MHEFSAVLRVSFRSLTEKEDWLNQLLFDLQNFNQSLENESKILHSETVYKTLYELKWIFDLNLGFVHSEGLLRSFRFPFHKENVPKKVFDCYHILDDENESVMFIHPLDADIPSVEIALPTNPSKYALKALAKLQAEHLNIIDENDAILGLKVVDESFNTELYNTLVQKYQNLDLSVNETRQIYSLR